LQRHVRFGVIMRLFNAGLVIVAFLLGFVAGIWWIRQKRQEPSSAGVAAAPKLAIPANQSAVGFLDVVDGQRALRAKAGADVGVSGWAGCAKRESPLVKVEILVDQRLVATAALAFARPDVADVYGRADFQNSGWKASFPVDSIAEGDHELSARATCASGESSLLPAFTLVVTR